MSKSSESCPAKCEGCLFCPKQKGIPVYNGIQENQQIISFKRLELEINSPIN